MPALKSVRQERFCQLVKQGIPPYRAYPQAGYAFNEGSPYRLHGNARVKARISELTRSLAMKTQVTVQSLTDELDEARALAARVDQPSAMTAATIAKGKLHGLMVDRKESGDPGAFAGLQSEADVLAKVRAELGDEAAQQLGKALGKVLEAGLNEPSEGDTTAAIATPEPDTRH